MRTPWKSRRESSWSANPKRLGDYPEVQAKVKQHLAETHDQLSRLERCLEACGESSSTLKDAAQSVMANTMAMAHAMAGDEILKNTFANNAFEHFEIAAYKSLLSLCTSAGQEKSRPLLEANLKEEEQMASWIEANVAKVTQQYAAVKSVGPPEGTSGDAAAGIALEQRCRQCAYPPAVVNGLVSVHVD